MEAPHHYPVFFDCPGLDEEQRRKIEKYFQIRRKSAGGDCGSLTEIRETVYSIAFKHRDAQQRVLQRREHVLELAGRPLVLTVRDSPGPAGKAVSQRLDLTSLQQSPESNSASIPPPSDESYELRLDSYLIRYLNECPNAGKQLERELASVCCSAQLHPEEEKVSVRSLAPPGAADEGRNWKAEVDKVLGSYLCHYELDPHKVKALLQSCSSRQTTDEVKVYSEVGLAVVVGERSQVNARLADIEVSRARRASSLCEKQTSIRRLGEAKVRLLWKDIEHSLSQDFPGVKVMQGGAGQIVLEGSAEEILKVGERISDMERLVFGKTVSDKSPHFLAFLRKVYGGPGVLGGFLGVGDNVEVELGDTKLRFFSLSADKLDEAVRKLEEEFKEVKINLPNCSSVPSELREKLKSKTNEMNRGQQRAQVMFDAAVWLLGHTEEVEELSEAVTQFILDQSSIEGKVILPFPELAQQLPELLQLHGFDCSGVTFHPLTSSESAVVLGGPSSKVTAVRNRLGPFLDSLVQSSVTIDLPGVRYFQSPSGRESICRVARSQKCLIQLREQSDACRQSLESAAGLSTGNATVASYSLCDGLQVLVCHGDITKQEADVLVNAANEDLDHRGGVAAALSKAGGPEVQSESTSLVKRIGKVATGDVVVTTGGNLNCKKLLHAVGPEAGTASGRERILLEKAVRSALNLSEMMDFQSIAFPCISCGAFGIPIAVCCEAIVTVVKEFGSQGGRSLSRITLIDKRGKVVRAMHEACDRLLRGISPGNSASGAAAPDTARGASSGAPGNVVCVEIVQGTIETQQVDVLVSPMVSHDLLSTRVGHALCNVVGPQLKDKFEKEAGEATLPGDTVLVEGLPALKSKGVFFLNLVPWDDNQDGTAVQVLRRGLRKILASCAIRRFGSVALPVLGTGAVLRFPHSVASRVLLEEIRAFENNRNSSASFLVRIVIHSSDKDSSKAFQSSQETLHLRGFTSNADPNQASFYHHVSITYDEVTAMLGGVKLQLVRGDIIHEGTDAIINSTDFSVHTGVSSAILTAAGPSVRTALSQVGNPADGICTTGPGLLGCKEIFHASFNSDPKMIRKRCKKILKQCESKGYSSAAFPAINTGKGGVDPVKACKAMLDGMTSAITGLKPNSLSLIRIVILQESVFQGFRSELENRIGQTATRHLTLIEKAQQKLKKWQDKRSRTSTGDEGRTLISIKPPPAVISIISCRPDAIRIIQRDLEGVLQKQLLEREMDVQEFSRLDDMELEAVQAKVKILEISLEHRRAAGGRSGLEKEVYVLKGLKEDVLSIIDLINRAIQRALSEDLQDKEEAMMALNVQWSVQGVNGGWHELSLHDNYVLEEANIKNEVSVEMMAPDGEMVKVNLRAREATNWLTGITYKVRRIESETELPKHWEPMHEDFKKVKLQPDSPEYKDVSQGFHKTAKHTIQKIERVQNRYLWQAFAVCRQRILAKNGPAELGEKILYHGTSAGSCNCIERDRFDRSYAGTHAALYGKGVYFAVNAEYSATRFSPADAAGLKRLYVARVLTGRYKVGSSSMNVAPPRGSDPTDCFDSVVDNKQSPSMFVIFHDDQAYPEYLITFS